MAKLNKIYIYEYNGVVQASLEKLNRFADEGEDIIVGVGCDEDEAREELTAKLEAG